MNGANGSVKEEPIEFVDSDDDLDSKPPRNLGRGNGTTRAVESPSTDNDDPQALFKVEDRYVLAVTRLLAYITVQPQSPELLLANFNAIDRYRVERGRRQAASA